MVKQKTWPEMFKWWPCVKKMSCGKRVFFLVNWGNWRNLPIIVQADDGRWEWQPNLGDDRLSEIGDRESPVEWGGDVGPRETSCPCASWSIRVRCAHLLPWPPDLPGLQPPGALLCPGFFPWLQATCLSPRCFLCVLKTIHPFGNLRVSAPCKPNILKQVVGWWPYVINRSHERHTSSHTGGRMDHGTWRVVLP